MGKSIASICSGHPMNFFCIGGTGLQFSVGGLADFVSGSQNELWGLPMTSLKSLIDAIGVLGVIYA
jgi:hypothetical protein